MARPRPSYTTLRSEVLCPRCGEFGHVQNKCPTLQGEKRVPHEVFKRISQAEWLGGADPTPVCTRCDSRGHLAKDCPRWQGRPEEKASDLHNISEHPISSSSRPSEPILVGSVVITQFGRGSGGGKCKECGATDHKTQDCPLNDPKYYNALKRQMLVHDMTAAVPRLSPHDLMLPYSTASASSTTTSAPLSTSPSSSSSSSSSSALPRVPVLVKPKKKRRGAEASSSNCAIEEPPCKRARADAPAENATTSASLPASSPSSAPPASSASLIAAAATDADSSNGGARPTANGRSAKDQAQQQSHQSQSVAALLSGYGSDSE